MFAIVKDNKIVWFTDKKITKKIMLFDELIEWNIDINKNYIFENWEIKESIDEKVFEIKQKYQDLIFSKYSLTDQLNMTNETLLVTAIAKYENRDFTEEEIMKLLENKDAKDWIDNQRKSCQLEIENLSNNQ